MRKLYFRNTKTGKRYLVVKIDKAANTITLKGAVSAFTEPYDKDRFKRMGYVLETEEVDDAIE